MERSLAVKACTASLVFALSGGLGACTPKPAKPLPRRAPADTVRIKDPDTEQRAARLQLRLLEEEAQVEEIRTKLDDAREQVVRAMAKLQTLATRAEAASGMAEAKIALDSLRTAAGDQPPPEIAQAAQLLDQSSAVFEKQNYGGALYLANQAKSAAAEGRGLLASRGQGAPRQGEVSFALPLTLRTVGSAKLREGPGTGFNVVATLDAGAALVAYSYTDLWVHASDENGHTGWVYYTLVGRKQDAP